MQTKNGDLLQALAVGEISALAHQANCLNAFGPIIAAKIKKAFPEAWQADCAFSKNHTPYEKLGHISTAEIESGGTIINIYGQLSWSSTERSTNYESLYRGLEATRDFLKQKGLTSIGFPSKLGSNRAGGDWRIIKQMLEVVFENSGIEVTIYEFNP